MAQHSGCTDSTACNYDASATSDDGSCTGVVGCMDCGTYWESLPGNTQYCNGTGPALDAGGTNYDPNATCDDGVECLKCDFQDFVDLAAIWIAPRMLTGINPLYLSTPISVISNYNQFLLRQWKHYSVHNIPHPHPTGCEYFDYRLGIWDIQMDCMQFGCLNANPPELPIPLSSYQWTQKKSRFIWMTELKELCCGNGTPARLSNLPNPDCTFQDFYDAATGPMVGPTPINNSLLYGVWTTQSGTSQGQVSTYNFVQNMWNHYNHPTPHPHGTGCDWFKNRLEGESGCVGYPGTPQGCHEGWILQLAQISNAGSFWYRLKAAKIAWAEEMQIICDCP